MELRTEARENANIVLTNPDMLHASVLPYHEFWCVFTKRQLGTILLRWLFAFQGHTILLTVGCGNLWKSRDVDKSTCQAFQVSIISMICRSGFFKKLKYVVIDEAHMYRGVFGSHVAAVLRRLVWVGCLHYPCFVWRLASTPSWSDGWLACHTYMVSTLPDGQDVALL